MKPQHENHPLSRIIAETSRQAQTSGNSRNLICATKMSLTYELQWPRLGGLLSVPKYILMQNIENLDCYTTHFTEIFIKGSRNTEIQLAFQVLVAKS